MSETCLLMNASARGLGKEESFPAPAPKSQARQEDRFAEQPQLRPLLDSREGSSAFMSLGEGCWPLAGVWDLEMGKSCVIT